MGSVLNLAHRGASKAAPENTLAAFELAVRNGAHGVELDVQLSADNVPVVIHDATVDRTTDGHGHVRRLTLDALKRCDAGRWKSPRFAGQTIPTLDEALDCLAGHVVNVELKTTSLLNDGLEERVVESIAHHHAEECVVLSSFNPLSLARVRSLNARLCTGLLYSLRRPMGLSVALPTALHPNHKTVDEHTMAWARAHRFPVRAWTVDNPDEMRRLLNLGVEAIITNVPDILLAVLSEPRPNAPGNRD